MSDFVEIGTFDGVRFVTDARGWPKRRFILRVNAGAACGPSGAGARAGDRNPRLDSGIRLTVPDAYRLPRP